MNTKQPPTRASIELYDSYTSDKGITWQKKVMLYCAYNCAPSSGKELESLTLVALQKAKASGLKYWFNSLRIAQYLITQSTHETSTLRLFPVLDLVPNSSYLWRIYLGPDEGTIDKMTCHKIEFDARTLTRLTPVEWQKAPKREQAKTQ